MAFDFGIVTGPLLGVLANAVQNWFEKDRRKVDAAVNLQIAQEQTKQAAIELAKIREAGMQTLELNRQQGENESILESLKGENNKGLLLPEAKNEGALIRHAFAYVDFVSKAMRPHITFVFAALLIYLNYQVFVVFGTKEIVNAQSEHIIKSTLVMAEAIIMWWFGTRMTQQGKVDNGIAR